MCEFTQNPVKECVMRMRHGMLALVAACGLMCNGCGQTPPPTPPPDATTDTPILDIDQGIEVPAGEVEKKPAPAPENQAGDAKADAGTPGGQ